MKIFALGERVTYLVKFIRDNCIIDFDTANRQGTVESEPVNYGTITIQRIRWDDNKEEVKAVNVKHLVAIKDMHKEAF